MLKQKTNITKEQTMNQMEKSILNELKNEREITSESLVGKSNRR